MMRETTFSNSIGAYFGVSGNGMLTLAVRSQTGGFSTVSTGTALTIPAWLKLVRIPTPLMYGSTSLYSYTIKGYYSTDGITWTLLGSQTLTSMAPDIVAGLAVCSNNPLQPATATFDHVSVINNVPQPSSKLVAWYRADSGVVLNGTSVAKWQDQSGNGNDALQATTANQPAFVSGLSTINNEPALQFTASAVSNLTAAYTSAYNSNQATVIAVVEKTTSSANGTVLSRYNGSTYPYFLDIVGGASPTFYLNSNSASATVPLTNLQFGVVEGVYNQTNVRFYTNGLASTPTAYTTALITNTAPLEIGAETGLNGFDGYIAELLVFNQGLSDSDRQQVESYLYQKYNLGTAPLATAPVLSEGQGIYGGTQTVTLNPGDETETIYYTTDGTDPSSSSTRIAITDSVVLTFTSSTTLRTYTVDPGYSSNSQTFVYTIDSNANFSRSSLLAWYRADAGLGTTITNNTPVPKWADQSGNGNDAVQATPANQPAYIAGVSGVLNGQPLLRFNSANVTNLALPYSAALNANQATIIAVTKKTTSSGLGTIVSRYNGGAYPYFLAISGAVPAVYFNTQTVNAVGTTLTAGTYGILEGVYDQTSARIYVDGALETSTAGTTALLSNTCPLQIGAEVGLNTLDGDIAEVMIFNKGLTDSDRQRVEAYLSARYGITYMPQPKAPAPTFSEPPGIYGLAQNVILAPGDYGETVAYTTDGTDPQTSSTALITTIPIALPLNAPTGPATSAKYTINTYATEPNFAPNDSYSVSPSVYTIDTTATFSRSSLVAWYRADLGTGVSTNGQPVSKWQDQSGNGNDAVQATSTRQPLLSTPAINGQPALLFTAANVSSLAAPFVSTMNSVQASIIAVVKKTNNSTYGTVAIRNDGSAYPYFLSIDNNASSPVPAAFMNTSAGNVSYIGAALPANSYNTVAATYDQASVKLFVNGVATTPTAYTAALVSNSAPLQIGAGSASANPLDGDIAELLVFNQGLNDTTRKQVEAYLYQRYNIGTQPSAPPATFSENAGIYSGPQYITIAPSNPNESLYYTTDGSAPTTNSISAASVTALNITNNTPLQILAVQQGLANSTQAYNYRIDSQAAFNRANLLAWYRADSGFATNITNGTAVPKWLDQSGNGNDAVQATTANQPAWMAGVAGTLNACPTIKFTAASLSGLAAPYVPAFNSSQVSMVAVVKRTGGSTYDTVAIRNDGSTYPYYLSVNASANPAAYLNTSAAGLGNLAATTGFNLMEATYDQANFKFYVNGVAQTPLAYTAALMANTAPLLIGDGYGSANPLDGSIAELLIFNQGLSDFDRVHVEAYLYQRYGPLGSTSQPTAPSPTLSVGAGTYSSTQTVTLTPAEASEIITYTTDGSDPSTVTNPNNPAAITVSAATTLTISNTSTFIPPAATTTVLRTYTVDTNYAPNAQTFTYTMDPNTNFNRTALVAWYRADSFPTATANNTPVSTWADQSGNGNDAVQATTTNQPAYIAGVTGTLNNLPLVRFNSAHATNLAVPYKAALNTNQATIIAVTKRSSGTATATIVSRYNGGSYPYFMAFAGAAGTTPTLYLNTSGVTVTGNAITGYNVVEGVYDQTSVRFYANGTEIGTPTAYTTALVSNTSPLQIGAETGVNVLDGDIAEVMIFSQGLTDIDRQRVEAYLNHKYGTGIPLPQPSAATPTLSEGPGIYSTSQVITLTPKDSGQTIKYTTDGSDPSTSPTAISSTAATEVTIGATGVTTLKISTTEQNYAPSSQTLTYTIEPGTAFNHAALVAWYRSDSFPTGTANNTPVSTWADQSGNGNDAVQATLANQPAYITGVAGTLNGVPLVRFNSAHVTSLSAPYTTALNTNQSTIIAVTKRTTGTALGTIVSRYNGSTYPYLLGFAGSGGTTPAFYLNSNGASALGSSVTGFNILEGVYDQVSVRYYSNGLEVGSPAAYTTALVSNNATLQIGAETGLNVLDGDVAEVMVFNQGLSDTERQKVEAYLFQRYGMGTQLTAPTNVTVGFTGTTATLNWTEQTPGISSYTLQESTDGATWTTAATGISGSVTTYTLTGLTTGVNYSFRLIALDSGNISSPSAIAAVVEKSIGMGWAHTVALKPDGTVWTWGYNADGQLGNSTNFPSAIPVQVPASLPLCSKVAAGYGHSLAISATGGAVWAWGNNTFGQLADGTAVSKNYPVPTTITTGATAISAGNRHSLALVSGGLKAWGANDFGQLGQGNLTAQTAPVVVSTGTNTITAIAAGNLHSVALTSTGALMAWGDNTYGQSGQTISATPVESATLISSVTGTFTQVTAGTAHSVALKNDGTVWVWGANYDCQLGTATGVSVSVPQQVSGLSNIVAITAFADYTLALGNNGTLYGWGRATTGQLGAGVYWAPAPQSVNALGNWQVLAAGGEHVAGLRTDNLFWNWGYGQATSSPTAMALTSGSTTPIEIPLFAATVTAPIITQVSGGDYSFIARASDGSVWTWGLNNNDQTGDGTTIPHADPVQVAGVTNVANVQMSPDHALALKSDGTVWGWGSNLSFSNAAPQALQSATGVPATGVTAIAAANQLSVFLKTDGTVWASGDNSLDQFGTSAGGSSSTWAQVPLPGVIKAISATANHVLALDNTGNVWAWGSNNHYQLGLTSVTKNTPAMVAGFSNPVVAIATAGSSSFAIDSTGQLLAWGDNTNGKLGTGSSDLSVPTSVTVGSGNVLQMVGNDNFTAAYTKDGKVYTWGLNTSGQLGNGTTTSSGTPALSSITGKVIGLATGLKNAVALKEDGSVSAWGTADTGQLGVGATLTRGSPYVISGLAVGHLAPTLTMTSSSLTVPLGQSAIFTAAPQASLGATITKVDFYQEGEQIGEVTTAPYQHTWSPSTWGNFHFYAVATDSAGAKSVTTTTPITVQVPYDSDANGLPDWWELEYFGQLGNNKLAASPSGDGYTILQDYQLGRSPTTPQTVANYRYDRGTSSDPTLQSFVVSLNQVQGVPLSPMGNDAAKFSSGLPWFEHIAETTAYQINVTNNVVSYPTAFQNPVVAFGASAGGTPLYTGQSYSFGVSSGGQPVNLTSLSDLRISVYNQASFTGGAGIAPVAVYTYTLPRVGTADWTAYAQTGFSRTYDLSAYGLMTTFKYVSGPTVTDQWGNTVQAPFILTHTTVPLPMGSPKYYYRVDFAGAVPLNGNAYWMATNDTTTTAPISATNLTTEAYSVGYTLDFTDRLAWQSAYISEPQFAGQPLPPTYAGKSVGELLKVSTPVTYQFGTPDPTLSQIGDATHSDPSPELRYHPILDKFVKDMGTNPITLTNYVLNEIHLTDGVSYNDSGNISEKSINPGGVNRGALATFLEKQGSPAEQCALLIYFLRKCSVPCGYVFPPHDSLQMLDSRMSQLLRMQIQGAIDPEGNSEGVPQVIPVNYPWVAAYLPVNGTPQWVHIFPWLKDTSITEGYDVDNYLPNGYQTGLQWLQKYLNLDPAIWSLNTSTDDPAVLYPAYITSQLAAGQSNLSIADMGVTCLNRKNNFNNWTDFPQPWQLNGTLSSSNLISSLSAVPNIFDTVQFQVFSDQNNNSVVDSSEPPIVDTGVLRTLDLHDRRTVVRFVKTGTNTHTMYFSLDEFRPQAGAVESFPPNGTLTAKQSASAKLTSADDHMLIRLTYNRHRSLPTGFSDPEHWDSFLGVSDVQQIVDTRPFRKGDAMAVCLDYGQVTQDMLDAQAGNFLTAQQASVAAPTAAVDPDVQIGTPLYLMGLQYYKAESDFRAQLEALHKVNVVSFSAHGLTKLSPQRNPDGTLPNNGDINLIHPSVDMSFARMAWVNNGSVQANISIPETPAVDDWANLFILETSAQEHITINNFFNLTDSISTTNLLTKGEQQNRPMVVLTSANYLTEGAKSYTVGSTTLTLAQWADVNGNHLWEPAAQTLANSGDTSSMVYMTPGPVVGAQGTYEGMGVLVLNPNSVQALIGGNIETNGGDGANVPVQLATISPLNFSNMNLQLQSIGYSINLGGRLSTPSLITGPVDLLDSSIWATGLASDNLVFDPIQSNYLTWFGGAINQTTTDPNILKQTEENLGPVPSGLVTHQDADAIGGRYIKDPVNVIAGDFYIHAHDLHLEGPMPIDIYRNYDSADGGEGAFGVSWSLGYQPYLVVSPDSTMIYAAETDGTVVAYRQVPGSTTAWTPQSSLNSKNTSDNPNLSNQWGNGSAGSIGNLFNNRIDLTASSPAPTYVLKGADGSIRTFVQASYPVTGAPSLNRQRPYLQKWQDAQGNYLTFAFGSDSTQNDYGQVNRITSSNSNYVQLNYDVYGHVTHLIAGDGRITFYGYDQYGDLVSATMTDGSVTKYSYGHKPYTYQGVPVIYSTHLLTEEDKPQGRVLQNVYDSYGRVTQQSATCGKGAALALNGKFSYSNLHNEKNTDGTITGSTQVSDAYNRVTQYDYLESELKLITYPIGETFQQTWWQLGDTTPGAYPRAVRQKIDRRNLTTNYLYDTNTTSTTNLAGQGNPTEVDTIGDITGGGAQTVKQYLTYNTLNLPTDITDIDSTTGNHTSLDYGVASGLTSTVYLVTGIEHWTSGGMVSETVNTYSNFPSTIGAAPFAASMLTKVARAALPAGNGDEADANFGYNNNGFLTSESYSTGTSDPAVTFTSAYNLRGELIKRTDAAGQWTGFAYDGLGNRVWEERHTSSGNLVDWNYNYFNANGEIEWSQGSRYNPVNYVQRHYDGAGRLSEVDNWRSAANAAGNGVQAAATAVTQNQYDLFGDLLGVTDPNGNTTLMGPLPTGGNAPSGYDKIGRPTSRLRFDASGAQLSSETFSYEPGGDNIAQYSNPLTLSTQNLYTQTGQIKSRTVTNPACGIETWLYYSDGRLKTYTRPDLSTWNLTYNDYGRTITSVLKDNTGATIKTETEGFDRRANAILQSVVDESTFTSNTTYDGLDRVKTVTGPAAVTNSAQQSITHVYDAAGQVETTTNALGESTVTGIDALGRPTLVQIKSSGGATVRSRSYAYAPDQQSATVTDGAGTNTTTTYTDFAGNPVLVNYADGTSATSTYDGDENLLSSTDQLGQLTQFQYDGLNHITQQTLPDGAAIGFVCDAMGNVKTRSMPAGLTWTGVFDNASRETGESLTQGTSTTRTYAYLYNTSGTDIGRLQQKTDPRGNVTQYTYDGFGRLKQANPGSVTWGVNLSYLYDTRGLLKEVDQNYTGQGIAPVSIFRTYDGYGNLVTESQKVNGLYTSGWLETHDGAGRRTMLKQTVISGSATFGFGYNADGTMANTTFNGSSYSYTYGLDGLLTSRVTPWKTETIASRDSVGRITEQTGSVGGTTVLDEKLNWRGDSTLSGYTAKRTGTGTWNEARQYAYDSRGHLLSENYAPGSGTGATLAYQFDNKTPGLLGLRTGVGLSGAVSGSNAETYDGLAHLNQQATTGTLNDPRGTPVVTNPAGSPVNARGEVTAHNPSTSTDALSWDDLGRLVMVTRRDTSNNGFNWVAGYDPLGRRLSANTQPVVAGVNSGSAVSTSSFYDPEAEFEEVYNSAGTQNRWLVHGPDLNEAYGGLNGTGGVEAVVNVSGATTTGIMSDAFGNTVATGTGTITNWNAVRSLGYGPQPGTTAQILDATHDVASALAWRGRYIDPTGFYNLGARTYDPASGTFLSCDPLGHAASMDLYSYCNGDPINGFDADGRIETGFSSGRSETIAPDAPNSFAFALGYYAGAIRNGAGSGLQNGAGGDLDALTFGKVRGAFGSDTNSHEYLQGQIGGIVGRESLITAGTLGLGQLARGGSMAAYYGFRGATTIAAGRDAYSITEGSVRVYNGDNWGYLEAGLGGIGFVGNVTAFSAIRSPQAMWKVGPHGEMPSPRPDGFESHHGVNSVWMRENFPGYDASTAPAVLMRNDPFHNATRGVFNTMRAQIAKQQGVGLRNIDWTKVSPGTIWKLSETQFEAAQTPQWVRKEYFRQFNAYLDTLQ